MGKSLKEYAKKNKIKYFMISFTDIFGAQRAKLVPSQVISEMEKDGAGFAGFATWLDMTPAHPDMLAIPDPKSVIQLPWQPDVAWLASDLVMEGKEVLQAPRNVLKKLFLWKFQIVHLIYLLTFYFLNQLISFYFFLFLRYLIHFEDDKLHFYIFVILHLFQIILVI